jgi:hypothetical protein
LIASCCLLFSELLDSVGCIVGSPDLRILPKKEKEACQQAAEQTLLWKAYTAISGIDQIIHRDEVCFGLEGFLGPVITHLDLSPWYAPAARVARNPMGVPTASVSVGVPVNNLPMILKTCHHMAPASSLKQFAYLLHWKNIDYLLKTNNFVRLN